MALTLEGLFFCSLFPDSVKRLFGQLLLVAGTNYQPHLIFVAHPRRLHCFHGAARLERPCSLFRPRSVHSGIAEGLSVLAACAGLCGTCVPLLQSQGQGRQPVLCSVSGVLACGCRLRSSLVGASLCSYVVSELRTSGAWCSWAAVLAVELPHISWPHGPRIEVLQDGVGGRR